MKAEDPNRVDRTHGYGNSAVARSGRPQGTAGPGSYEAPHFEVICLACEISAYAPDEDGPLF